MATVNRSALVNYSAESMFDLVNDVDAYPQFLPGCADAKVLESSEECMKASVKVSKAGVSQWFTTENRLKRGEYIDMKLLEGPFSRLTGGWRFTPLSDSACKIELHLEFAFSNRLVGMAFGKAFNVIANNMVDAFTKRAKEVYS